jgi:hypothetical protein
MPNPKWLLPNKRWGAKLVAVTWKVSLPFNLALREYASQQSELAGRKISMATIVMTLCLRTSPELRQLYSKYEQLMPTIRKPVNSDSQKSQ